MRRYAVETIPPGAFNGYRATVTRYGDVTGTGYGDTEARAIDAAWRDYWQRCGKAAAP